MPTAHVTVQSPDHRQAEQLALVIRRMLGFAPKQYDQQAAKVLLDHIHQNGPAPIPVVSHVGDFPCLMHNAADDSLYFPALTSDLSRLMGTYYYTGAPLIPQDHGGLFEKWLSTFRCATPEDTDVLRAWCIGAMLQQLVPSGGFPALLIAAHNNGAGKTATAEMLSAILGRCLNVYWPSMRDEEGFMRKVVGGGCRLVLIDNMVPEKGERMIDASNLASMITRARFTLKKLYVSYGSITAENRYLYILTANQPMLSPELLSRVVLLSLDSTRAFSTNWVTTWAARRQQLLEDLMWTCVQGWRGGAREIQDRTYRFPEWWLAVARVLGRAPSLRSCRPAVRSCYSWAVERLLGVSNRSEIELSRAARDLNNPRNGMGAKSILQQQRVTEKVLLEELSWTDDWEIVNKEGGVWLRPKYGDSSLPTSGQS